MFTCEGGRVASVSLQTVAEEAVAAAAAADRQRSNRAIEFTICCDIFTIMGCRLHYIKYNKIRHKNNGVSRFKYNRLRHHATRRVICQEVSSSGDPEEAPFDVRRMAPPLWR